MNVIIASYLMFQKPLILFCFYSGLVFLVWILIVAGAITNAQYSKTKKEGMVYQMYDLDR